MRPLQHGHGGGLTADLSMPPVFVRPVAEPRCARAAGGRMIDRSPRTPELQRSPATRIPRRRSRRPHHRAASSRCTAQAARAGRAASRVAPIAGRSADRRRWLGAPLAFNARPHHLRPEPDSAKKNSIKRNGDKRNGDGGSSRAPRARAGVGAIKVNVSSIPLIFQCRLFAMTPYRCAAAATPSPPRRGGRIPIVRPERPSSSVRPQPNSSTAQPSTSPSCGQQPLHRPGGSSRSSSIAGRSDRGSVC